MKGAVCIIDPCLLRRQPIKTVAFLGPLCKFHNCPPPDPSSQIHLALPLWT